jgi:hypothetical protein
VSEDGKQEYVYISNLLTSSFLVSRSLCDYIKRCTVVYARTGMKVGSTRAHRDIPILK